MRAIARGIVRRSRTRIALALVVVMTVCAGCTDDDGPRTAMGVATDADRIEEAALDVFGDEYAGLGLVDDELVVFTAGTIPQELPDELEGVPVASVQFNLAQLDAFKARLDAVADDVIAEGVRLVSWGIDPATNSISIGVASDVSAARNALVDALGADLPLTVHAEAPVTT